MIELKGKYNTEKVFTDTAEQSAVSQIEYRCITSRRQATEKLLME